MYERAVKGIVLDSGHGGNDPGASANGIIEKDLTLKISQYMYDRFRELGIPVAMTRTSDETLSPTNRVDRVLDAFGNGKDVIVISNHINAGMFIVPDDAVDESMLGQNVLIANYKAKDEKGKERIEEKLINSVDEESTVINASTKISIYEASVGLGALVTFIGLYLGIIFLISSAAILALKELTESTDNIERYNVLRALGADEKLINKALFRQIFIFFIFPLALAIIHSIFGIMFSNYLLSTLGNDELLSSIIMTAIFIVFIYGGYFIITYICSKNIIKGK